MNASVEEKVSTPGLVLAAVGGLQLAFGLLFGLLTLFSAGMGLLSVLSTGDVSYMISWLLGSGPQLVWSLAGVIAPILTIMAGLRLKSGTSPSLVYAGAIVAMIPCCNSCCFLGLIGGGWAIFTMQDEEVKAAMADA